MERTHINAGIESGADQRLRCSIRDSASGYNTAVEKTVRVFASFEEADQADARSDAALSPEQRLRILIELRDLRHPDASEQRLARVSRVTELERS